MIERVARAAHDAMMADRFDDLSENCIDREIWRNVAKAAIEAMRRPTQGMVDAALSGYDEDESPTVWADWRSMIDAALKEE